MKVTVTQGVRVVHDGTVYQDGQSADVPEGVARCWIQCGWASEGRTSQSLPDPRGLASIETDAEPEPKPATKAAAKRTAGRMRR
jgi:hypothetical protein